MWALFSWIILIKSSFLSLTWQRFFWVKTFIKLIFFFRIKQIFDLLNPSLLLNLLLFNWLGNWLFLSILTRRRSWSYIDTRFRVSLLIEQINFFYVLIRRIVYLHLLTLYRFFRNFDRVFWLPLSIWLIMLVRKFFTLDWKI
jgi:hypothetical protein